MKEKIRVSGSLSCIDILNARKEIEEIEKSDISFLHYDVVDGKFNECFVFGDLFLEKIRPLTKKPIEVHLAVEDVEPYLVPFCKAGADYIAVHYETPCDHKKIFQRIRELGAKPILAFRCDSEVPADFIELAKEVEWILKLTVNPGFAGQKMQKQALQHIEDMRRRLDEANLSVEIQADGNINEVTIPLAVKAGANILTGGTSGLFNAKGTIDENLKGMLKVAKGDS